MKTCVMFSEVNHCPYEIIEPVVSVQCIPVNPSGIIILAISVIVAALAVSELVTGIYKRDSLRTHDKSNCIPHEEITQFNNLTPFGRAFDSTVPAQIIIGTVTIIFAIGFVMLAVI